MPREVIRRALVSSEPVKERMAGSFFEAAPMGGLVFEHARDQVEHGGDRLSVLRVAVDQLGDGILVERFTMGVDISGLGGGAIPIQGTRVGVEELGPGFSHHMMWHGGSHDFLHHGQMLPVVMGLEKRMSLK